MIAWERLKDMNQLDHQFYLYALHLAQQRYNEVSGNLTSHFFHPISSSRLVGQNSSKWPPSSLSSKGKK